MVQNQIIVDTREKHESENADLTLALDKYQIPYTLKMLPCADILISNPETNHTLAIERKEINDFVESSVSGRLHREIEKLNTTYERSILVIEGSWEKYTKRRIGLKAAGFVKNPHFFNSAYKMGILSSITLRTNTKILFTNSMDETIALINALSAKFEDGRIFEVPLFKRAKTEDKIYINLLLSFPGVSQNKAQKIMEKYTSWADFSHHILNKTFELSGFGQKTIDMMFNALSK